MSNDARKLLRTYAILGSTFRKKVEMEESLIKKIKDKGNSINDVIKAYAETLMIDPKLDWGRINDVIVKRWSKNALGVIKRKVWKIVVETIVDKYKNEYEKRNE